MATNLNVNAIIDGSIAKAKLAADVQTSLGKADTAIQEHQSLAAYRTSAAQDVIDATKQDTISDLSTIRSGAALGATAYQKPATGIPSTDMASAVQTSLGKANTAIQSLSLEVLPILFGDIADILPNFHYITDFTSITSETPATGVNLIDAVSGKENNYIWVFHTGAVAPTIIWPADWQWISSAPTINANKVYEVRICDNGLDKLAVACEYSTPSNE